jgi:molybdopterin converting factor small subunit
MKKLITLLIVLSAFISSYSQAEPRQTSQFLALNSTDVLQQAFENQTSNFQIEGKGTVLKLLNDDTEGRKHQKFLLKLASGQTVMVAHNIDLSTRLENLKVGDEVAFYGEYEWNNKGGVIHWTHHDPQGRHINGWLKHQGQTYQ